MKRIALFEDEPEVRVETGILLQMLGHKVQVEAATVAESISALAQIAGGEVAVDAIALDGNLGPRKIDCADARLVYEKMQELGITLPLFGFSHYDLAERGIPVIADVHKNGFELAEELDKLPQQP